MRKATDQRDARIISLLWTSLLPFHGGDVLCFELKCFDVLMSVAGSGDVVVTSFDAMLRDAMRCHGDELLYVIELQWDGLLSVLRGHVVCFEVVLWRCGGETYYSVLKSKTLSGLQSTTPVLLQY